MDDSVDDDVRPSGADAKMEEGDGDGDGASSDTSTIELDPSLQVLVTELKVSVEEAQRLMAVHGTVMEVMRLRLLEATTALSFKKEPNMPKLIFKKEKKVEIKEEHDDGVSDYEDAVDGMEVEDDDEIDGADAAASSAGAAAPSATASRIRLVEWREGVPLKRWCFLARRNLRPYATANDQRKKLAVFERLAVDDAAFAKFLDATENTAKSVETVLEDMANDTANSFSWRKRRAAHWPKFTADKDSITAFNMAMQMEKDDSGATDAETRAAYLSNLSGMARNIASMRVQTEPQITVTALMDYVKNTLEKRDTQADYNLLESFLQAEGKISKFAPALLEQTCHDMMQHGSRWPIK